MQPRSHCQILFMLMQISFVILVGSIASSIVCSTAWSNEMIGVGSDTPVYPRPNSRYRPIFILKTDKSLKVSPKIVKSDPINFFKVLLYRPNGKSIIGYVAETANVRIKTDTVDDDDFVNYSEQALSSRSISSSLGFYRGSNYLATLGYQYYLSPGFYMKFYVGEWFSPTGGGDHFGGELGNDTLISRQISLIFALGLGTLLPAQNDGVFLASQSNGVNYLLRGIVGVKWNGGGRVSFGLEGVQTVLFNSNNSLVTFGGQLSIEVGI